MGAARAILSRPEDLCACGPTVPRRALVDAQMQISDRGHRVGRMAATILALTSAAWMPGPVFRDPPRRLSMCAVPTPEELLLGAVGYMRDNDLQQARDSLDKAKRLCDSNGGATEEQTALINLLSSRLPAVPPRNDPTLQEMFPGTAAAPTGESLVLPGTPSMAELAKRAKEKRQAAIDAARRAGDAGGPQMCVEAALRAQLCRRATMSSLCALSLATLPSSADAETELEIFDYLSPARFAVKKQQQKQEQCYAAGACADAKPYYAIVCERDDTDCLQRKRRLASQEVQAFAVDPTSSPILLLAASAFVFQWGSAALRIGAGLVRRARGASGDDGED